MMLTGIIGIDAPIEKYLFFLFIACRVTTCKYSVICK
jgi:hypothetical protein